LVPAGYPTRDSEVMILDDKGEIVADGGVGEICVSGPCLSPGYWNDPVLTARVFRPHPHDPQKRVYHTGDLGRWRNDGALEVLGRKDTQIKIRGFRVQLETVDLALRSLEGIADAATIVDRRAGREQRLIAYVSMLEGHPFSVSRLRKGLASRLPSHSIPSVFVRLDALPRNPMGKLARLELPEPTRVRPDLETAYAAPRNNMEAKIAGIWERLLDMDGVGIDDSFFELGGDSLMALEMTLEVERILSRPVPQAFLKHPTIAGLIALLANETSAPDDEDLFAVRRQAKTRSQRIAELNKRITVGKLKRLLTSGTYAGEKIDWLVDLILARHIVSMPYTQAREWALGWSQNAAVRRLLYRRRFALFSRWVASLDGCRAVPSEAFQMSVLTNMLYGLPMDAFRKVNLAGHSVEAYRNSPFAYWQTLGEILDALPVGEASEQFPIRGTEHLTRAYEEGHGVILLSFHGFPIAGGSIPLKRLLGLKRIPTISFLVPRRGTRYASRRDQIPAAEASALNAKVALLGQKTLQQGGIVNFASDWSDAPGRRYQVSVAGRLRQIKAGFAELAINTGATIIPHIRHCLEDGRIQMEFGDPLQLGGGEKSQQVQELMNQYVEFIERSWAAHPEAMRWYDILDHFALPLSEARR
jgi:acyl carrier protein